MRYTELTNISALNEKYDAIIGWGAGREAFVKRYNPFIFKMDAMIDSSEKMWGRFENGIMIEKPEAIKRFEGQKVLVVIFPNLEDEIIASAKKYLSGFDTIVAALIESDNVPFAHFYATEREDLIFMHMLKNLQIDNPSYMDIGVCHPVIRNNTYMLYEKGFFDGVLVEPNPDMCDLIEAYRPNNCIVKMGASPQGGDKSLKYFMHPNPSYRGHNTFDNDVAIEEGFADNYREIPVMEINEIVGKYCKRVPDIIDIDTEGMDYDLLSALDCGKYPIKIICVEIWKNVPLFDSMMRKKGYVHFMSTYANNIYIREELLKAKA